MFKYAEYRKYEVRLKFEGRVTSEEIKDANTDLINHPEFGSLRSQLWIFEPIDDFVLSVGEIRQIANQDIVASRTNPEMKVAIFSTSSLVFGLGRMYEAYSGTNPWEVMVFRDLDKAEKWLNS